MKILYRHVISLMTLNIINKGNLHSGVIYFKMETSVINKHLIVIYKKLIKWATRI